MKKKQQDLYLPSVESSAVPASVTAAHALTPASAARKLLTAALAALALVHLWTSLTRLSRVSLASSPAVRWKACGTGLECTTISAPLNWRNSSDPRTVEIAVAKWPADKLKPRLGSIFVNPGGPGGSGTGFVHELGGMLSVLSGGQYDIIGFDPRGVNATRPYVSCFDSALDEYLFARSAPVNLDLPVNFSAVSPATGTCFHPEAVINNLEAQVRLAQASISAVYDKCAARSGDALAFIGTESVVRDIDHMSKLIDGEKARINFWGYSYGTILGQYLTAILPPERIGRVAIDGVVDGKWWASHKGDSTSEEDVDRIFEAFATECAAAGEACALSHLASAEAILAAIDGTIDSLYATPQPLLSLPNVPGLLARAYHLRQVLFAASYGIGAWPLLAEWFAGALKGDYSELVRIALAATDLTIPIQDAPKQPDTWRLAVMAIRCADSAPFAADEPAPTTADLVQDILDGLDSNSRRAGEWLAEFDWCHLWRSERKSFYNGTFEWPEGALDTPVLVLSQRLDPVTPLGSAKMVSARYGYSNARLVEQNGTGHCTISQASLATAKLVQTFWLKGEVPAAAHTFTHVDQVAFPTREQRARLDALALEDGQLLEAWSAVGDYLAKL